MSLNKSKIISTTLLSITLIVIVTILNRGWQKTHLSYQTISVTGLGQKDFKSDLIIWEATFSRSAKTLAEANKFIATDLAQVKTFMLDRGISEKEVTLSTVKINRDYKSLYNNAGSIVGSEFEGFTLLQHIIIESKNIELVEKMAGNIGTLIEMGIEFSVNEPNYYFTQLKDLKIELLKQASMDGYLRAKTIAENAKTNVGTLKNGTMGVFQITGQNSNEDYSWGGSFNTKAKYKSASITVKLEFEI